MTMRVDESGKFSAPQPAIAAEHGGRSDDSKKMP
jgi:hypothetical protein